MPRTIYLANPYGFSAQQRELLLPPLVTALEQLGLEVWEPFARKQPGGLFPSRVGLPGGPGRLPGRSGGRRLICRGQRAGRPTKA